MKRTSVMLDQRTRALIDEYCQETNTKISDAFRKFIHDGIASYKQEKAYGAIEKVGENGLMLNEKLTISASLQTLFILRKIIDDHEMLIFAKEKAEEMMQKGWIYNSKPE